MKQDIQERFKTLKKIPPDGGWGWMIVLACVIFNSNVLPLFANFGLLYKHKNQQFQLTGYQITLIINICTAIIILLGLVAGVLFKWLGHRKLAIIGGLTFSLGIIGSAFTIDFITFFICIIFSAIGIGLGSISFSIALSVYFIHRHPLAHSISMIASGILGAMYPFLLIGLFRIYTSDECILIIGTIGLNTILAGYLLQPIEWHLKDSPNQKNIEMQLIPSENGNSNQENVPVVDSIPNHLRPRRSLPRTRKFSIDDPDKWVIEEDETEHLEAMEILISRTLTNSLEPKSEKQSSVIERHRLAAIPDDSESSQESMKKICFQLISTESVNLGSSFDIFLDRQTFQKANKNNIDVCKDQGQSNMNQGRLNKTQGRSNESQTHSNENPQLKKKTVMFQISDLKLKCTDFNILISLSFSIFAEINFLYLLPFILIELNYTAMEIAIVISVITATDTIFRLIGSVLENRFHMPARGIYIASLLLVIIVRRGLVTSTDLMHILIMSVLLGVVKGFRNTYVNLILPAHIPFEKLPFACGLQVIFNSIVMILFGPLVGGIKDISGNFALCVSFLNLLTLIPIFIWTIELICIHCIRLFNRCKQNSIS